jgi:hypothetical protein
VEEIFQTFLEGDKKDKLALGGTETKALIIVCNGDKVLR